MLSVSNPKSGKGGGYYFRYYDEHSTEKGIWHGSGSKLLGLHGAAAKEEFTNVLNGFSPDGSVNLVQNAGAAKRQAFWDLTFSVPKAVSVLYGIAPELRDGIRKAAEESLIATLERVEEQAGFCRIGKNGKDVVSAKLTFAVFCHETSRLEDPQLHFHCVLINAGVRPDGSTGALKTRQLFDSKIAFGSFFRSKLASALEQSFGFEIEKQGHGFSIKGVPDALCETLSKRRQDIEAFLKDHELKGGKASKSAALKTRGPKLKSNDAELTTLWQSVAERHGLGREALQTLVARASERLQKRPAERSEAAKDTTQQHDRRVPCETTANADARPTVQTSKTPSKAHKRFCQALWAAQDRIFPENQTKARLFRVASELADQHGVTKAYAAREVMSLKLPVFKKHFRIEYVPLFPKAPLFSLRKVRAPRVVLQDKPKKWGKIDARVSLLRSVNGKTLSIAVQKKNLVPKAPKWSPLSKISLPSIRLRTDSTQVLARKKQKELERQEERQQLRR